MTNGDKVQIRVEPGAFAYVRLHPEQSTRITLHHGEEAEFTLGPRRGKVFVMADPTVPEHQLWLSRVFADRLYIREVADDLSATINQNGIHFHSFIGILCNPKWQPKQCTLRMSRQLPALQRLCEAASAEHAVAFLFGIRDLNLKDGLVNGYSYENGHWSSKVYPLPNVVYDQVVSRRQERRQDAEDKRAKLSALYGNKLFNDGFLDKWQVHEWLQNDARIGPYISPTIRYTNAASAAKFISQHPVTFCKPVHGSLGLGIIRIEKCFDGGYEYWIRRVKDDPIRGACTSPVEIAKTLQPRLRQRAYILQQGVALQPFRGRPFDVRIVMQRNGRGAWMRTKMFARVADEGQITSNLASGGEALSVSVVLAELFRGEAQRQRVLRAIRRCSRLIPDALEAASGKQFGELGIDLGIDDKGGVWVIEVNSKPWKTAQTERGRKDLVDLSFARPMQYAVFLASQQD